MPISCWSIRSSAGSCGRTPISARMRRCWTRSPIRQAVTLFHRFDLTQSWVTSGQVDLERVSREQRDKTIGLLNDCLGEALARYVLAGAPNTDRPRGSGHSADPEHFTLTVPRAAGLSDRLIHAL